PRSQGENRPAAERGGTAFPELRASGERPGRTRASDGTVRQSRCEGGGEWRVGADASRTARGEHEAHRGRARADVEPGPAESAMVQAPDLCARILYRIWGEDAAGGPG